MKSDKNGRVRNIIYNRITQDGGIVRIPRRRHYHSTLTFSVESSQHSNIIHILVAISIWR